MRVSKTVSAAFKSPAMAVGPGPFPTSVAGRLFGLDAGDWSMVLLGLVISGLMLAFV
jgi:hypothetical protein